MSALYLTARADDGPEVTRAAHHSAHATVRTWGASIRVSVWKAEDGTEQWSVTAGPGSTDYPHSVVLFEGSTADLLRDRTPTD